MTGKTPNNEAALRDALLLTQALLIAVCKSSGVELDECRVDLRGAEGQAPRGVNGRQVVAMGLAAIGRVA